MHAPAVTNIAAFLTILIVDDIPASLDAVARHLESQQIRVLYAQGGEEAMERTCLSPPDLILLDARMPGLDGFETCRRLKANSCTSNIPVIFMIALPSTEDIVKSFAAGGADYVVKPLHLPEVTARIHTFLTMQDMQRRHMAQNAQLQQEVFARTETEVQLRRARNELGLRVAERTRELEHANALLTSEIAERRRAQNKLQVSEARFRSIVESSPVAMAITAIKGGKLLYGNQPFFTMFGIDPSTASTWSAQDFYANPADRHAIGSQSVVEGRFSDIEVLAKRVDGAIIPIMASSRRVTFGDTLALCTGFHDLTERKRIEDELLASREQLRKFSAHLETAREDERKHIAMEIHDELGQLLTALKMDVSLLEMKLSDDLQAGQKLGEMRELVERTISMVRHVANHMRPAALNYGIVPALEWLAENFVKRNDATCQLHVCGSEPVLDDRQATAVFRLAQESLTNAARHAGASEVTMTLATRADTVTLTVNDNGRGFDPGLTRPSGSYGLLGMSERARVLGAALRIESSPGAGATIFISIPLQREPEP